MSHFKPIAKPKQWAVLLRISENNTHFLTIPFSMPPVCLWEHTPQQQWSHQDRGSKHTMWRRSVLFSKRRTVVMVTTNMQAATVLVQPVATEKWKVRIIQHVFSLFLLPLIQLHPCFFKYVQVPVSLWVVNCVSSFISIGVTVHCRRVLWYWYFPLAN